MNDNNIRHRLLVIRIIIIFSFFITLGRIIWLQGVKGDYFKDLSEDNMVRSLPIPADRGTILDRNGKTIVKNNPGFTISILSFELRNPSSAVSKVKDTLHLSTDELRKILMAIQTNPSDPIKIKEYVDYPSLARLAEIAGDYPGIYVESYPRREYPMKELACHIIGYLGEINLEELDELGAYGYEIGDIIGKEGIENEYDRQLRGNSGARHVLVNVEGKMVRFVGEFPPETGSTIILNIDRELQETAEYALKDMIELLSRKNSEPSAGAIVVMSCKGGEVLSMASYPAFDPNLFSKGISLNDYRKLLDNKEYPMLNRAIHSSYPCASTYKMITGAAALQEGLVKEDSSFRCSGVYMAGETPFNCFVRSGHGSLNFIDAIAHSCDVVFYMLADEIDLSRFLKYSSEFGIGKRTGIDLPGESRGLLPSPEWKKNAYGEEWYAGDTINMAIGQGYVGVTPLQLAVATSAVANGGFIYRPHVVREIISSKGKIEKTSSTEIMGRVSISPENLAVIRKGMRGAVKYGTAKSCDSPCVDIAGKTGTAENYPSSDNPHGRNHSWFTCFAPYKNPEIVVTVFLEKSGGFGGEYSAPVARKIIESHFRKKL